LYMVAYVGSRRAVRSRRTLVRFQRARDESAALLEESRLEAFRRQLQPATVLDALDALRALYRGRPKDADDLLDVLVGFLRTAVHGLGGETATLSGELDLAGRYLRLRALTAGKVGTLSIESGRPAPEVSFPPRLLTPVLEHLCAAASQVSLRAGWRGDVFAVTLAAEGVGDGALPRPLRQRMAVASERPGATLNGRLAEEAAD
ncbi:MAG: histidine kinase, partial [Pseudomonadota bacterium]|nr:histidine kinase [Pseudomonadota bacterium]